MNTIHETTTPDNTPRTRNQVLDNTPKMRIPDGVPVKGDWTFRRQLEADFRALGFKSHKFSHKNEPETRSADALWLSWNSDSKKRLSGAIITDITVPHDGRERSVCIARRMGKAVFTVT